MGDERLRQFDRTYQERRKTTPSSDRVSDLHPLLRRLVALLPQSSKLQAGETKAAVRSQASKTEALHLPYVTLNDQFLAVIRVDVDEDFGSWDHLQDEIMGVGLMPCLPNLAVGKLGADGRSIVRPHLMFFLPPGSEVWADFSDPRCRKRPVRLWRGVTRALTEKLLSIGADPGGLANPLKIKNPLSPEWIWTIPNEGRMLTLSEWVDWIGAEFGPHELQPPGDETPGSGSNNTFEFMKQRAWAIAQSLASSSKAEALFGDDRLELEQHLLDELKAAATEIPGLRDPRGRTAKMVAAFTAERFDLARHRRREGKLKYEIAHLPVDQRKAAAGRFAAAERERKALDSLTAAARQNRGEPLTKMRLSKLAAFTRPTVNKHWDAVEDRLHGRHEYLKLRDYGRSHRGERRYLRDVLINQFMSYEQPQFLLDLSSLPETVDCGMHCEDSESCIVKRLTIEKSGFPPDGLTCYEAKLARPSGRLLIRLRDYTAEERGLSDP